MLIQAAGDSARREQQQRPHHRPHQNCVAPGVTSVQNQYGNGNNQCERRGEKEQRRLQHS